MLSKDCFMYIEFTNFGLCMRLSIYNIANSEENMKKKKEKKNAISMIAPAIEVLLCRKALMRRKRNQ